MKQLSAWNYIYILVATTLVAGAVYLPSGANDAAIGFFLVACCTLIAAGTFFVWAKKSFLRWR